MSYASQFNRVNLSSLKRSVGKGGANLPLDVLLIQRLLNGTKHLYQGKESLLPDGIYGPATERQIPLYQKFVVGMVNPDMLINVNRVTHRSLVASLKPDYLLNQQIHSQLNQKSAIDTGHFKALYKTQFPGAQHLGSLVALLKRILGDADITDVRWVAYMLATVRRECGGTWQPIREWGRGRHRLYGNEIKVTDPVTGKEKVNVYYGRGYVQLTWDYNYRNVGELLGMGQSLYINPDEALKPDVAYKIMSLGMRKGIFANASLAQFLSGKRTDYVGARRIINGNDHAEEIARDARDFEELLFASSAQKVFRLMPNNRFAHYA